MIVEPARVSDARRTLSDVAYNSLKDRIVAGALPPGDWIAVDELAGRLKMSRQPVMEALRRLSVEGFIEIVPQVGSRVSQPQPADIADFFRFFAAAEGLTAEFAALRRSAAEIKELRLIHQQIGALRRGLRPAEAASAYRLANRAFHRQIHAMAHSQVVSEMASANWDRSDFYIAAAGSGLLFAERLTTAHAEHDEVLAAIVAADGPGAARAMQAHILGFAREMPA